MGEGVRDGDDRTFRVNFAGDGAERLRGSVKEKLKEFMGDYTDDTLVEYVVVLLRNGRRKEEAKRELNVFLGDDSDSFVSWLWDHLSINLHLYVQPKESLPDESANRKTTANVQFGGSNTHIVETGAAPHTDSEHEIGNLINFSRSRRKREWKGLVGEMTESFPLRSTVIEALHSGEKTSQITDIRHSSPPRPQFGRKRRREDERLPTKRDPNIFPKIAPPRRLLEFAVRDAVKTVQQSSTKTDPAVKRLRSMVSASMDTMLGERSQMPRSTLTIPGSVSVALKAAAEAAEDVTKSRNAGSVFDRLGHGRGIVVPIDQSSNLKEHILQDDEVEEFDQSARSCQGDYNKKNEYDGEFAGNSSILDRDADPADSASDNDAYDDFGISSGHVLDASHSAYIANKRENSVMLHYNDSDADAVVRKTRLVPQDPRPSASAKPASKIVNISVNVNTWKPPDYQASRKIVEGENQLRDKSEGTNLKPNVPLLKGSTSSVVGNGKEMASTDTQKDPQKPQASTTGVSYTTSRPSEDVDTRTIFISNVHFAATKDTLSRHFNKFGEVLKVIIMTDSATGQPIGSAYVEFLRKESAELALSLNGTSFMSRILKVVRRSFVEAPVMSWPRIARASPFPSRLGRLPFPRGAFPGTLRARLPVKTGARSLQWKRDAGASHTTGGAKSFQNASGHSFANVGRNLTYVRPEPKNLGNSGVDF